MKVEGDRQQSNHKPQQIVGALSNGMSISGAQDLRMKASLLLPENSSGQGLGRKRALRRSTCSRFKPHATKTMHNVTLRPQLRRS